MFLYLFAKVVVAIMNNFITISSDDSTAAAEIDSITTTNQHRWSNVKRSLISFAVFRVLLICMSMYVSFSGLTFNILHAWNKYSDWRTIARGKFHDDCVVIMPTILREKKRN